MTEAELADEVRWVEQHGRDPELERRFLKLAQSYGELQEQVARLRKHAACYKTEQSCRVSVAINRCDCEACRDYIDTAALETPTASSPTPPRR